LKEGVRSKEREKGVNHSHRTGRKEANDGKIARKRGRGQTLDEKKDVAIHGRRGAESPAKRKLSTW